ncbi:hypothetical protein [Erwinia phage vB_Ea277G]|nr:hypothetical protein [Erwinia phage vB_Ea277G]
MSFDLELFDFIHDDLPQFNPRICEGFVGEAMESDLEYLDSVARCADEGFPPEFRYMGIRRLSPLETVKETLMKSDSGKREFDIAESDLYLAEMLFKYTDPKTKQETLIPKPIFLPFAGEAGNLMLSGTTNTIASVLGDPVFTVTDRDVFVIFARAKFTMETQQYQLLQDGETVNSYVVKVTAHNARPKTKASEVRHLPKTISTTGHYLFCKYGVTDVFRRFYGLDVIVCDVNDVREMYQGEQWTVLSSKYACGIGRPVHSPKKYGMPTQLNLVFRTDQLTMKNTDFHTAAAHFFYVVDHFPLYFNAQNIDHPDSWKVVMGYTIHRSNESEGKLLNKIDNHLDSLDRYVDVKARRDLRNIGIDVRDIYEFFIHMNDTIQQRMNNADPGNMWGKYLMVNRYVYSSITDAIFNLGWSLNRERHPISLQKIKLLLGKKINILSFPMGRRSHGEITSVQFPGDCYLFKYTCNIIRQTNAVIQKGKKKKVINVNDVSYHLHPSVVECGSYCNFPKPSPDGRTKLNPFAWIDDDGMFIRNPKYVNLLNMMKDEISTF